MHEDDNILCRVRFHCSKSRKRDKLDNRSVTWNICSDERITSQTANFEWRT